MRTRMDGYPILSGHPYRVIHALNPSTSDPTQIFLGQHTLYGHTVLLTWFPFTDMASRWASYDHCARLVKILRPLQHVSIPPLLETVEAQTGICLVQTCPLLEPLDPTMAWSLEQVQQLTLSLLDSLIYLQGQTPALVHRQICPEAILIQSSTPVLQVYLSHFGQASQVNQLPDLPLGPRDRMAFTAPEDRQRQRLTTASDLYGLGFTLGCLLTQTAAAAVGSLQTSSGELRRDRLPPKVSTAFIDWLARLTAPLPQFRFLTAVEALAAMPPISRSHHPPQTRPFPLPVNREWPEVQ